MLKGLEVSEVKLSKLENFFDWSPEYYKSDYIEKSCVIRRLKYETISDFSYVTDGEHGSPDWDEDTNIKYITAEFIKPNYILEGSFKTISLKQDEKNKRAHLQENDVLIYSVGAYAGYTAVAENHLFPANIPRSVAIVRPNKNRNDICSEYLSVFLNSKYGVFQAMRFRAGNSQPVLALEKINQFEVPIFNERIQSHIKCLYKLAYQSRQKSKDLYQDAENILLNEIGLENFQPSNRNTNIKTFSESFLSSGRLDADYYLPKYEEYLRKIENYSFGFEPLNTICNLKDKNFNPDPKTQYQYIELSNIGRSGDITDCTFEYGNDLPSRARRKVHENDLIVSSIEGSLESCALITKNYDNALCSTGFYVINSEKINSETLLVLFKSRIIQEILKQSCSGTILTAINKNEFLNIPLPLIKNSVQKEIKERVLAGFRLRQKSKNLLEIAKHAVEIAIEQDESEAEHCIQNKCTMLDVAF